jgi:hypothetical protein
MKIKNKQIMKKGFTLLEIAVVLSTLMLLSFISKPYYESYRLDSDISKAIKFNSLFISTYINDPIIGYRNASSGSCSSNYTPDLISSKRIIECSKKNNLFSFEINDFLLSPSLIKWGNGIGCSINVTKSLLQEVNTFSSTKNTYNIIFNCTSLSSTSSKLPSRLYNSFINNFKHNPSLNYIGSEILTNNTLSVIFN